MANNHKKSLLQWLNEDLLLNNNEVIDEELSNDKDIIIARGKDSLFPDGNNFTEGNIINNELETENIEDNFEFVLDKIDINFVSVIEPVKSLVIFGSTCISISNSRDITGPSNDVDSLLPKNLLILQKK